MQTDLFQPTGGSTISSNGDTPGSPVTRLPSVAMFDCLANRYKLRWTQKASLLQHNFGLTHFPAHSHLSNYIPDVLRRTGRTSNNTHKKFYNSVTFNVVA
jgi:hypothetical protein